MNYEMVSVIVSGVASIAAVVSAMIAAVTLGKAQKQQKMDIDRKKKKDTLDAYNNLQEQVLDYLNRYSPSEIKGICEDSQSVEYKKISSYLARIEHFCIGLNVSIYDWDTFYEIAHGYFDSDRGILKPRLLPILEQKLASADKDYFSNLHKVWAKMDQMR